MIAAVGSARPFPAMSGALPCTGSNIDGFTRVASMLPLAANPTLPVTIALRSMRPDSITAINRRIRSFPPGQSVVTIVWSPSPVANASTGIFRSAE